MYAVRRTYVQNWELTEPKDRYQVTITKGGKPAGNIKTARISAVDEEVMYWRKANHIHRWFVENAQDGEDNCGHYFVDLDKLKELLGLCNKVIESSELVEPMVDGEEKVFEDAKVANDLLPTQEGFFFGCTDYDQHYLDDTVATRDWIIQMLDEAECGSSRSFFYHASW